MVYAYAVILLVIKHGSGEKPIGRLVDEVRYYYMCTTTPRNPNLSGVLRVVKFERRQDRRQNFGSSQ